MNPYLKAIAVAVSMRREIKLLFGVVLVICLLPVFAVIIVTQTGINLVSDVLASANPQTAQVDIHDPATGEIVAHIDQTATWPVAGPISLEFGQMDLPYQPFHTGIDIASPAHQIGDPVVAFMKGTVTYADTTDWGYGRHVKIDNENHISSVYGHLDTLNVTVGQPVEAGSIIGTRGSTGWSTGPHLHFEIRVFGDTC